MILSDGTTISFQFGNTDCNKVNTGCHGLVNYCSTIVVDINGSKKPNTWGRDIFMFGLKKDGLYPAGVDETDTSYKNSCSINSSACGNQGGGCAARVIAEGDMNY